MKVDNSFTDIYIYLYRGSRQPLHQYLYIFVQRKQTTPTLIFIYICTEEVDRPTLPHQAEDDDSELSDSLDFLDETNESLDNISLRVNPCRKQKIRDLFKTSSVSLLQSQQCCRYQLGGLVFVNISILYRMNNQLFGMTKNID